jgi:hypothetical protein
MQGKNRRLFLEVGSKLENINIVGYAPETIRQRHNQLGFVKGIGIFNPLSRLHLLPTGSVGGILEVTS